MKPKDIENLKKTARLIEQHSGLIGAPVAALGLFVVQSPQLLILGVIGMLWQFYFKPRLQKKDLQKEEPKISGFNPPV